MGIIPEDAAKSKVQFEKASLDSETYLQLAQNIVTRAAETPDTPEITVFESGFDSAWEKLQREIERINLNSRCSSCSLHRICQTYAACAKQETGAYDGIPDYMCRYTRELLRLYSASV